MLQTCNRCRTRRTKCDNQLPACAACTKVNATCTVHDSVLKENIPRSYVKSLYDKIDQLKSKLAQQNRLAQVLHEFPEEGERLSVYAPPKELDGTTRSMQNFQSEPPSTSLIVIETMKTLDASGAIEDWLSIDPRNNLELLKDCSPDISKLTPAIVQHLLDVFNRFIRPVYHLPSAHLQRYESHLRLNQIPTLERFHILMSCAIAARTLSLRECSWLVIAKLCRECSDELSITVITVQDKNAMVAVLLLSIYEMIDPSRGIIWDLIGLATRICLQLGWHRVKKNIDDRDGIENSSPTSLELMGTLQLLLRPLRMIFRRPSMLDDFTISLQKDDHEVLKIYLRASEHLNQLDGSLRHYGCPVTRDVVSLISALQSKSEENETVRDTWLLFIPLCIRHKSCPSCTSQAFSDNDLPILDFVRQNIIFSSLSIVETLHTNLKGKIQALYPLVASIRALNAGCGILAGMKNEWSSADRCVVALLRCTEVLTSLRSYWDGGPEFLNIWNALCSKL